MKKWLKNVGWLVVAMALSASMWLVAGTAFADCNPETDANCVETSILPGDWGIADILNLVLNIIVYGLGVAAVIGVIVAGIMYMTARDNEAQVTKAKTRLYEVVIGLIAWALMYVVLKWLIPGGLAL